MEPVHHSSEISTHPTTPTVWSKGAKGGFITGAILIVLSTFIFILDAGGNKMLNGLVSFFSLVIGIILTHKAFKNENNGFLSYGQGLGLGSVLGLISGILMGIFLFIYLSFVDASMLDAEIEAARYQYEELGMSDDQIDQSMTVLEYVLTPLGYGLSAAMSSLFYAFILSLIISAFTKNNNPEHVY